MLFKVGQSDVSKYYIGNSEINKIFLGNTEVFSASNAISIDYSDFNYSNQAGRLYFITATSPASGTAFKPSGWGSLASNPFGGDNRLEFALTTSEYSAFTEYFGDTPNFGGFGTANGNSLTLNQSATGAIITFNPELWQPFETNGIIRVRFFNTSYSGLSSSAFVGGYGTFNDTDTITLSFNEEIVPTIPNTLPVLVSIAGAGYTATLGSNVAISPSTGTYTLTATCTDPNVSAGSQTLTYRWYRGPSLMQTNTGQGLTNSYTFTSNFFASGATWAYRVRVTDSDGDSNTTSHYIGDIVFTFNWP